MNQIHGFTIVVIVISALLLLTTVVITYRITRKRVSIKYETGNVLAEYMAEARGRLLAYDREQRWFGRVSFGSLFFQYVVGAALAESFFQSQVNQTFVGWLGVTVVAFTVVRNVFKPDFRKQQADRKKAILTRAIRESKILPFSRGSRCSFEST